jgi:hypothetical protein
MLYVWHSSPALQNSLLLSGVLEEALSVKEVHARKASIGYVYEEAGGYVQTKAMKPHIHANRSVRKWGGKREDYQEIHNWFDQTKAHIPDMRHRAVLHNSFGIYLCEQVFGTLITNSEGREVSVRDIGEQHVIDDLGQIPTLSACFEGMSEISMLLGAQLRSKRTIPMVD